MQKLCGVIQKHSPSHRHETIILYFLTTLCRRAICKPRHWNLGIGIGIANGIGIETDFTNAIIFSSIRPMDPKLSRVVSSFNDKFSLTLLSTALWELCSEHTKCLEKCSKSLNTSKSLLSVASQFLNTLFGRNTKTLEKNKKRYMAESMRG